MGICHGGTNPPEQEINSEPPLKTSSSNVHYKTQRNEVAPEPAPIKQNIVKKQKQTSKPQKLVII